MCVELQGCYGTASSEWLQLCCCCFVLSCRGEVRNRNCQSNSGCVIAVVC